jgi:large subunit ribosomal protein L45
MYDPMKYKTMKWTWIESLEAPTVTHIITREMISKNDIYGQITVRLHSKQVFF